MNFSAVTTKSCMLIHWTLATSWGSTDFSSLPLLLFCALGDCDSLHTEFNVQGGGVLHVGEFYGLVMDMLEKAGELEGSENAKPDCPRQRCINAGIALLKAAAK